MVSSQTGAGYGPSNQKRGSVGNNAERGVLVTYDRLLGSSHRFPTTGMMSAIRWQDGAVFP